jgi:hypothetical protein
LIMRPAISPPRLRLSKLIFKVTALPGHDVNPNIDTARPAAAPTPQASREAQTRTPSRTPGDSRRQRRRHLEPRRRHLAQHAPNKPNAADPSASGRDPSSPDANGPSPHRTRIRAGFEPTGGRPGRSGRSPRLRRSQEAATARLPEPGRTPGTPTGSHPAPPAPPGLPAPPGPPAAWVGNGLAGGVPARPTPGQRGRRSGLALDVAGPAPARSPAWAPGPRRAGLARTIRHRHDLAARTGWVGSIRRSGRRPPWAPVVRPPRESAGRPGPTPIPPARRNAPPRVVGRRPRVR